MNNIGYLMYNSIVAVMNLGKKLYDVFTMDVSIKWVQTVLKFFGADGTNLPDSISLYWILTSASATIILVLIIYRLFK